MLITKHRSALLRFLLILSLAVVLLHPLSVYAHSGDTDSSGGHYDRDTGSYHYHCGGHPAHQHTGGICPYRYSSAKPSGSSSGSSNSSTTINPNNDDSDTGIVIFCTIIFIVLCLYALYKTYKRNTESQQKTLGENTDSAKQTQTLNVNPENKISLTKTIINIIKINFK